MKINTLSRHHHYAESRGQCFSFNVKRYMGVKGYERELQDVVWWLRYFSSRRSWLDVFTRGVERGFSASLVWMAAIIISRLSLFFLVLFPFFLRETERERENKHKVSRSIEEDSLITWTSHSKSPKVLWSTWSMFTELPLTIECTL